MASNTEKESQIALQALLQIGSNGQEQKTSPEAGAAGRGREGSLETSDIFRGNGNPSSSVANISHLLRMGASPSALLQQAQSRFGYSAAQMARIRAAAEASLRNNSNVANSLLSGFGLQRSFLESSFATQSPATSPPVLPRSPLMTPDRPIPLELQSPSFQTPKNSFAAAHPATPSSAPTTEEKVRKEEVEAALRSKPQRGKKRENLNAEERLELTRTRNREHAKSTRIRKKQRYQELLDTELKYLELQNTEDLNSKRRETIMAFFSAREKMLNRLVVDSVHSPAKASAFLKGDKKPSGNPSKEESQVTPQSDKRGVSFDASEFAAGQSRKVTPAKAEEDEKTEVSPNAFALSEIVEDIKHFKFESTLDGTHSVKIGAEAMSDFDEIIVHHLEDSTSFDDQNTVSYRVVGSVDGISINKKNDGFCRVDLILKSTAADGGSRVEEEKVLQTSVVSFHFSKESSKIRSASWCVLKDHMGSSSRNSNCGSVNGGRSESTGKESLESQTVYPSVVSLDPTLTTDSKYIGNTGALGGNQEYRSSGQQAEPKIENPGMDI